MPWVNSSLKEVPDRVHERVPSTHPLLQVTLLPFCLPEERRTHRSSPRVTWGSAYTGFPLSHRSPPTLKSPVKSCLVGPLDAPWFGGEGMAARSLEKEMHIQQKQYRDLRDD